MSQDQRFQSQRFELKYLIDESITASMRDFIRSYLVLDEYGVGRPGLAYPVHSVYLDSDNLDTHLATVNGTKNRFKLRLRYYDDKPNTPVFFEVKSRVNNCIMKQRCGVKREAVPLLVAGQLPSPEQMYSKDPKHFKAIQYFNMLLHQINARPKVHNSYTREAWVSPNDNSVRVTFDRNVRIEPYFKAQAIVDMVNPVRVFPQTILEVKFTTRFPNWLREMVRAFNLMQTASAKYSQGVLVIGEHWFRDKALDWGDTLLYAQRSAAPVTGAYASVED
ncbi:MAG TPA: polyphosphate polymerase domain-containing protein [Clostridia bacterium]|nr:polyphosphate polymerase domain-containing protein [Clostridia bacterium]